MRWFDHGAFEAERPFCGSLCQRSQSPEMVHTGRAVSSWVKLLRYLHLWCAAPDCPLLYIWGQKVLKNLRNPVLSSSKKCSKKEDGPLQWKLVNFSGLSNSYKILALHVWCCSNSLKTLKQMGCEESHGDTELSQKEQHLTQTCASSDAAQQHLVSAREVSPCRAHTRQTTAARFGNRCLVERNRGQDPGNCYDIASSFQEKNDVNCCLSPPRSALNDPRDPLSTMFPWAARTVKIHCGECSTYDSFGFVYCCIFPGRCYVTFFPNAVLASYKYSELSRREVLPISVLKKGI